ncbi:MAG: HAMP domain-containing sensor histidine kinase [candidate division Zixibacteria bacterium]|nr:HAMP domain-containing sensor histidine kinase [candidate division Zixibacteria bacterium]
MESLVKDKKGAVISSDNSPDVQNDRWLEMFSIFIHDIESPLASMKYLLKLIGDGKLDLRKPLHQRMVSSSHVALERVQSIIYDIMAVAKAGRVGLPVVVDDVDPDVILREAILLAGASAEEQNIEITYSPEKEQYDIVRADPDLLKRVIDNLLFNAIRHTPSGGTVMVYTKTEGNSVYIYIKDSGSGLNGIDPELLFEKYGQLHLRSQGLHRGVGLGLYFCKLAATGMGGTIMADDHPEGGAVFSLRLQKSKG